MQVEVKKFLFVGPMQVRSYFFESAQHMGIAEFTSLTHRSPLQHSEDESYKNLANAISFLKRFEANSPEVLRFSSYEEALDCARGIVDYKEEYEALREEKTAILSEIEHLQVFGEFKLKQLQEICELGKFKFSFWYCQDPLHESKYQDINGLFHINSVEGVHYYLLMTPSTWKPEGMEQFNIQSDLQSLRQRLNQIGRKLDEIATESAQAACFLDDLKETLLLHYNRCLRRTASKCSQPLMQSLFSVHAWIASSRIDELNELCERTNVLAVEVKREENDWAPTYLENKGTSRIGQDLVEIYDVPASNDKDPSAWVLWSFALFFAMIIGDGGYGLLFLSAAFWMKWKINFEAHGAAKRFWKLFTILSVSCFLWGGLTNAFFGLQIPLESPLRKVSLVHHLVLKKVDYHFSKGDEVAQSYTKVFKDLAYHKDRPLDTVSSAVIEKNGSKTYPISNDFSDSVLRELALIVGIIHLSISLLRYLRANWANIGWILFMLGAYLYFPDILKASSMAHYVLGIDPQTCVRVGKELVYGGMVTSLCLALIQHRLMGLLEFTNVIQIFSDALSYLRLYALGLAGAMMSATFNDFAANTGVILGALILILGHGINMILGIIGGVIHGLRLNFLEWYHYSFYGGGRAHKPLCLVESNESTST